MGKPEELEALWKQRVASGLPWPSFWGALRELSDDFGREAEQIAARSHAAGFARGQAERDQLRARLDAAQALIRHWHFRCDAAEALLREMPPFHSTRPDEIPALSRWVTAASSFLAQTTTGEAPRCYDTACRFYGQRHATPHEPPDEPEPQADHAFRWEGSVTNFCAVPGCGLPPSEHGR